jgi:hypothetical protein
MMATAPQVFQAACREARKPSAAGDVGSLSGSGMPQLTCTF